MAVLLPEGKQSFATATGAPLVGGKVFTYDSGTSTPRTTWSDANQTAPNANPVVLDGRGEASIYWNGSYKVVLTDAAGVTIWTADPVTSTVGAIVATTITASGAVTFSSTLAVTGAATFAAGVTVAGMLSATGQLTVATLATVTGATATVGTPMLTLANSNAAGITAIDMTVARTLRGRLRADATGNVFSVANGGGFTWLTGGDVGTGVQAMTLSTTGAVFAGTVTDATGNVRGIPSVTRVGAYQLAAVDAFRRVRVDSAVTITTGLLAVDDIVQIYNATAAAISIVQGAGCTLRQSGTINTGNRTLAPYGTAVVTYDAIATAVISGVGLT